MSWPILGPPNAYGETLRGLQSNLPFGEVFPLTVPVIWMPTSMSRLVSLRVSCPWQARESLDFLLRCHTLLSGLAVLSWTVPNVSPLAMILSLRWKKKLHLFLVFILSSSPTALSYHTSPWLSTPGNGNSSFCPNCKIKLLGKYSQRKYMPGGTWSMGEEKLDIDGFNSIWAPPWGKKRLSKM